MWNKRRGASVGIPGGGAGIRGGYFQLHTPAD